MHASAENAGFFGKWSARAARAAFALGSRGLTITFLLAILSIAGDARAEPRGESITFAFAGHGYVAPSEEDRAGIVYVPVGAREADTAIPIVVFLHGLNEGGPLHKWMGGEHDLRPLADALVSESRVAPFILAAPSQTRDASRPWGMWADFDLAAFVDAAERAASANAPLVVDRARVVVIGHSGGGCNTHGGALATARANNPAPLAIALLDTCFDAGVARALLAAPPWTRVWAYYQATSWERDFDMFRQTLRNARGAVPLDRRAIVVPAVGANAHEAIVERLLPGILAELLPP